MRSNISSLAFRFTIKSDTCFASIGLFSNKILPNDWNLNIDKKLQTRDRLIDVISEDKTRQQTIVDLAADLKLK
jgi:hypothetical protein